MRPEFGNMEQIAILKREGLIKQMRSKGLMNLKPSLNGQDIICKVCGDFSNHIGTLEDKLAEFAEYDDIKHKWSCRMCGTFFSH